MNDTKYFSVEAHPDDAPHVPGILAKVPEIVRENRWYGACISYSVKGTFEERKAVYKKVRRLGRGKVRFNIVSKSLECLHESR